MAYIPKNEIEINWCMFGQEVPETLKNKGFHQVSYVFNSCRPHQNRVIMQNKRINARFFCIFDVFMQSKTTNFSIYAVFGARFGVHFKVVFYSHSKSRSSDFLKRLFCLIF